MYRVFVIGNANSIWTKEYIKNIHLKEDNIVYLTAYAPLNEAFAAEYDALGVNVVSLYANNKKLDKIIKTIRLGRFLKSKAEKLGIDYIDIQSPPHNSQATILYQFLKDTKAKVCTSFWGSDIMRIDEDGAKMMKPLLDVSTYINVCTEEMRLKFKSFYGGAFLPKLVSARYGSLAFDAIDKVKDTMTSKACKAYFSLDEDKITVAIGHNGHKEQQHILVIRALANLDAHIKEKIELLIHAGYGTPSGYVNEIRSCVNKSGISYKIIEEMFDLNDIAKLRAATDIMIHAQTTDALSGSIRECLYAGAVLLNPSWINYEEFDKKGIAYVRYDNFQEMAVDTGKLILKELEIDTKNNIKTMKESFSWDAAKKDWMRIFNERTA